MGGGVWGEAGLFLGLLLCSSCFIVLSVEITLLALIFCPLLMNRYFVFHPFIVFHFCPPQHPAVPVPSPTLSLSHLLFVSFCSVFCALFLDFKLCVSVAGCLAGAVYFVLPLTLSFFWASLVPAHCSFALHLCFVSIHLTHFTISNLLLLGSLTALAPFLFLQLWPIFVSCVYFCLPFPATSPVPGGFFYFATRAVSVSV